MDLIVSFHVGRIFLVLLIGSEAEDAAINMSGTHGGNYPCKTQTS